MKLLNIAGSFSVLVGCVNSSVLSAKSQDCKCFPGDACWPSDGEWKKFNTTVGGRLIKTVPLGSPCHDPNYDAALCESLTSQWKLAPVHIESSSSVQAAIFANASCDVFTPRSSPCLLGNYVAYAVNVTGPDDIAATLKFGREKNIRLVIRNTGHDYMGRSTAAGGLAIWTHYLKGVEVKDWSDSEYTGKAVKIGAGAQGSEVSAGAEAAGLVVVTGECPTVGIAGGYTQSGGHSPLSSMFGLSADNTLEFEVVKADGQFIRADSSSPDYADIFWALSGGGSGNYGVVVSVTLRAHPDAVTSGASFSITEPGLDYSAILNKWHTILPDIVDSGSQVTYSFSNTSATVFSVSGYNRTQADLENALQPFIKSMDAIDVTLQPNYTTFSSYHDYYLHYYGPLPAGLFGHAGNQLLGGRLLLRSALPNVGSALNATMQLGVALIGQAQNVTRFASPGKRAVLPQWREAVVMSAYCVPYLDDVPFADMVARQNFITDTIVPTVERVTPNAGAYINEADFQQENWQEDFYGSNYQRLLEIKNKYDPEGIFHNKIAAGSEKWGEVAGGRLCKVC